MQSVLRYCNEIAGSLAEVQSLVARDKELLEQIAYKKRTKQATKAELRDEVRAAHRERHHRAHRGPD